MPKRSRWRQHLPFALLMMALFSLTTAMCRPVAEIAVPLNRTTIILALDISLSMCAVDVPPNRLDVAQDAMLNFIESQATDTRIGIVGFAGFAELIVPPTNDKDELREAVANLKTSLGTAIGSAIIKSLDAVAEINSAVPPTGVDLSQNASQLANDIDFYQPDIIVLLTDGANSQGPMPFDAAQLAVDRRVRVYTIGFGTTELSEMVCRQDQLGSDVLNSGFANAFSGGGGGFGFGGFGGGGGNGDFRRFLVIDEPTLQGVADMTGGVYFRAENAEQLQAVFQELPSQIVLQKESREISVIFSGLGAVFAAFAVGLSLLWNRYP
jgi:Ca-activated chloride channel family protein